MKIDIGTNEILFLKSIDFAEDNEEKMGVLIGNAGDKELIVQMSQGFVALKPLSFGQRITRDYTEFHFRGKDTLVLRCRDAKDGDGIAIRSPV